MKGFVKDKRQADRLEARGLPPREGPPLPERAPDVVPTPA